MNEREASAAEDLAGILDDALCTVGRNYGAMWAYVERRLPVDTADGIRDAAKLCVHSMCRTMLCDRCQTFYGIGDSPACRDGHAQVQQYHPFIPYFDVALGAEVTSLAERWSLMKPTIGTDGTQDRPRLEYREKLTKGDLSARRDRIEQERHAR